MEKFLKQNWFKVVIVFLLLVLTATVIYYWVIFLPNLNKNELSIKNQTTCSGMEQKVIDKAYPNFIDGMMEISSSNHYNSNLNKCFVEINYSFGTGVLLHTEDSIFDAFENKTLFDCVSQQHSDLSVNNGCYDHRSDDAGVEISKATFDLLKHDYMQK